AVLCTSISASASSSAGRCGRSHSRSSARIVPAAPARPSSLPCIRRCPTLIRIPCSRASMTPTATSVTLDSTASIPADVLVQEVGGETVLLDMAGGQYFGLDPVGTRIWQLLGELGRLRDVHQRLCAEFDADHER